MNHRWGKLVILIAAIGVAAVLVWRPQGNQQVDNRLIDDCLMRYGQALAKGRNVVPDHSAADEAIAAIRRIREPAVKHLVDLVEAADRENMPSMEGWVKGGSPADADSWSAYTAYYFRRSVAVQMLCELGPDASNGIPGLIRTFGAPNMGYEAERVLAAIGTAAVGPLVAELRSTNAEHRVHAANALNRMGTNAAKALPELRSLMMDTKRGRAECGYSRLGWNWIPERGGSARTEEIDDV